MLGRVLQSVVALSALVSIASLPAWAEPKGTFRAGACNGATALFQQAQGADAPFQIRRTGKVGSIVNAGNGEAGLEATLDYGFNTGTFQSLIIFFADDGHVRKDVNVHFCFRNSAGEITAFDKKLSKAAINSQGSGWYQAIFTPGLIGLNDNETLVKFTVDLDNQHGNIRFGNTTVGVFPNLSFGVDNINLNSTDCSILNNCD